MAKTLKELLEILKILIPLAKFKTNLWIETMPSPSGSSDKSYEKHETLKHLI